MPNLLRILILLGVFSHALWLSPARGDELTGNELNKVSFLYRYCKIAISLRLTCCTLIANHADDILDPIYGFHFRGLINRCYDEFMRPPSDVCRREVVPAPNREPIEAMRALGEVLYPSIPPRPAPSRCGAGEILVASRPTVIRGLRSHLVKKRKSDCIDENFYNDYVTLALAVCEPGFCEFDEILSVFEIITENKANWRRLAATAKKIMSTFWDTRSGQRVEVQILPNGDIYMTYRPKKIGEGSYKQAISRLGFLKSGGVKKMVALQGKLSRGQKEIAAEWKMYERFAAYRRRALAAGTPVIGLPEAELVPLSDRTHVLVQLQYDGDLRKGNPLASAEGTSVALQLVSGIGHMHDMGLVHGDIKELNVLFKRTGDKVQVDLSDFGLTRDPRVELIFAGTPGYMAPEMYEQLSLERSPDVALMQKRDIYAAGIMLLGWIQFPDRPLSSCGRSISNPTYWDCIKKKSALLYKQVLSQAESCLSPVGCKAAIVARCLNPDPRQRPTAVELRQLIEQVR